MAARTIAISPWLVTVLVEACAGLVTGSDVDTPPDAAVEASSDLDLAGDGDAGSPAGCGEGVAEGPAGPAKAALAVGPGFTDVSPRQVVRTRGNVLYVVAPPCDSFPDCPGNGLRAWRGDVPGTPSKMVAVDPSRAPGGTIGSCAAAIDGCDRIHVAWLDREGRARAAVVDAATDTWGPVTDLGATDWTDFGQGDEGVALAVDAMGAAHVVFTVRAEGLLRLRYTRDTADGWTTPLPVDDVPLSDGRKAWHPALAFAADGALVLAWLEGTVNYAPDGTVRVRVRSPAGDWGPSVAIPETAMTGLDNGPSLMVGPDGVRHLAFDDTRNHPRTWYDAGAGWRGDRQPPPHVTHDPALGPDGRGGLYLWGHGEPTDGTPGGHGDDLYRWHQPAGGAWTDWSRYVQGRFDGSVSPRWSQFFHHFPGTVDVAYWADPYPNVLYVGTE